MRRKPNQERLGSPEDFPRSIGAQVDHTCVDLNEVGSSRSARLVIGGGHDSADSDEDLVGTEEGAEGLGHGCCTGRKGSTT